MYVCACTYMYAHVCGWEVSITGAVFPYICPVYTRGRTIGCPGLPSVGTATCTNVTLYLHLFGMQRCSPNLRLHWSLLTLWIRPLKASSFAPDLLQTPEFYFRALEVLVLLQTPEVLVLLQTPEVLVFLQTPKVIDILQPLSFTLDP